MFKKHLLPFLLFSMLGMAVFFLPIREHDYLRLRYFAGLWFFAEAAYRAFPGEACNLSPLHQLVGRYSLTRDRIVAGLALSAFFVILYLAVWLLMGNEFVPGVKVGLAVGTVLLTWLAYYGICYLFGSQELRRGAAPKLLNDLLQRYKKS